MHVDRASLDVLWHDADHREAVLRQVVAERLATTPPPLVADAVVATYFFALRTIRLAEAVTEIIYHATSGVRQPIPGSLVAQCTAQPAGVDEFDGSGRIGLIHVAFPLKLFLQPDGHVTSSDLLHSTAGAIIFDVYENQDARLVALQLPERLIESFPGPAYGPLGIRQQTGLALNEPAFGTILKPTAGVTPEEAGRLVAGVAQHPLLVFVKEDENLFPNLAYSPAADRARQAVAAIERERDRRGARGLMYAPHVSGAPQEILETVQAVMEAGATGVMFSETFAGGTVRLVREATRHFTQPPAIYGHNAGIGVKTRAIWREVIDLLARLDGIDFRQTAPVRPGPPFLRPYGAEWEASEEILTRPLPGIRATMIVRAGALDQGNIGLNLADAECRGRIADVLFLAGSAITAIKNERGHPDPKLGAEAMEQAVAVYCSGELRDTPPEQYLRALIAVSERRGLGALRAVLRQRYAEATS